MGHDPEATPRILEMGVRGPLCLSQQEAAAGCNKQDCLPSARKRLGSFTPSWWCVSIKQKRFRAADHPSTLVKLFLWAASGHCRAPAAAFPLSSQAPVPPPAPQGRGLCPSRPAACRAQV